MPNNDYMLRAAYPSDFLVKVMEDLKPAVHTIMSIHGKVITTFPTSLRDADLHGLDLSLADLRGADLSNKNLSYGFYKGADLTGANLSGTQLEGVRFNNAKLTKANLSNAEIIGCRFDRATILDADFSSTTITGTYFEDCYGNGANFKRANLYNTRFTRSRLESANFCHTTLEFVNFSNAIVDKMRVTKARIRDGVTFSSTAMGDLIGYKPKGKQYTECHLQSISGPNSDGCYVYRVNLIDNETEVVREIVGHTLRDAKRRAGLL